MDNVNPHLLRDVEAALASAKKMADTLEEEGVSYLNVQVGCIAVTVRRLDRSLTGVPNIHLFHDVER